MSLRRACVHLLGLLLAPSLRAAEAAEAEEAAAACSGDGQAQHGPESQQAGCRAARKDSPLRALASVSHWSPEDEAARRERSEALLRTLRALASLPGVESEAIVLTNRRVPRLDDLVVQQVVRPTPRCARGTEHNLCMPWEALKALRSASSGGALGGCDLDEQPACGELLHDYYLYLEDDIEVPTESFGFWARHTERLYSLGYLLLPHRREAGPLGGLTDCFDVDCLHRTRALKDAAGASALYGDDDDPRERVFLRPDNPYAACFWMTRAQFRDYLSGVEWDFLRKDRRRPAYLLGGQRQVWGTREQAAGGLLWDRRFGPRRALTHLRVPVVHQLPVHAKGAVRHHPVSGYEEKVRRCAETGKCKSLEARSDEAQGRPRR